MEGPHNPSKKGGLSPRCYDCFSVLALTPQMSYDMPFGFVIRIASSTVEIRCSTRSQYRTGPVWGVFLKTPANVRHVVKFMGQP